MSRQECYPKEQRQTDGKTRLDWQGWIKEVDGVHDGWTGEARDADGDSNFDDGFCPAGWRPERQRDD